MKLVHVAVAVIERENGDICIAKRAEHQHQGGLWEFPGGKVEPDETISQALKREILEELGVTIVSHEPLISIRFRYPDKHVLLDVHKVTRFLGEPTGREGQPVIWCPKSQLHEYSFPEANKGILNALLLPSYAAIVNELNDEQTQYIMSKWRPSELLIYLRGTTPHERGELSENGYRVMEKNGSHTLHLTSMDLLSTTNRPDVTLLSASCHTEEEVIKANELAVDFIFVAPILPTPSHPESKGMGWECFKQLAELAHMPVYALGGVHLSDLELAKAHGAQGIAGIRAFQAK